MSRWSEQNLRESLKGWRKADLFEAFQNFLRMFAIVNLAIVALSWTFSEAAEIELAFLVGLVAGLIFAVASMIFNIMPVFDA